MAWDEFKKDFEYDGSKKLEEEQLKVMAAKPCNSSGPRGMTTYIVKFQAIIAELEVLNPFSNNNKRKKMTLLTNIKHAESISHLVQKCRDEQFMTYDEYAAYIRQNALFVDRVNQGKAPSKLLFVQEKDPELASEPEQKTDKEVFKIFHSLAIEEDLK